MSAAEAAASASLASEAAKDFEELALCDVCGEGDWEDDNMILFCDSCDLGVHQACYGSGANVVPAGAWYCDSCEGARTGSKNTKECVLCPRKGGALKRTSDSRWAHIVCALWVPEAQFLDAEGRDIIHPFSINEKRLELTCSICNEQGGACVQCKAPRCLTAFHPSCARLGGVHMVEKEKDEWVEQVLLCEKHRPAEPGQKKKRRRKELKW